MKIPIKTQSDLGISILHSYLHQQGTTESDPKDRIRRMEGHHGHHLLDHADFFPDIMESNSFNGRLSPPQLHHPHSNLISIDPIHLQNQHFHHHDLKVFQHEHQHPLSKSPNPQFHSIQVNFYAHFIYNSLNSLIMFR